MGKCGQRGPHAVLVSPQDPTKSPLGLTSSVCCPAPLCSPWLPRTQAQLRLWRSSSDRPLAIARQARGILCIPFDSSSPLLSWLGNPYLSLAEMSLIGASWGSSAPSDMIMAPISTACSRSSVRRSPAANSRLGGRRAASQHASLPHPHNMPAPPPPPVPLTHPRDSFLLPTPLPTHVPTHVPILGH
jgi:hypothetical protein